MPKILVIEDNLEVQRLLKSALNAYELVSVPTLKDGRQALAGQTFDLVLLDLMLPDGDGLAFFNEMQTDSKFKAMPVIILTAKDSTAEKVTGLSLGVDDYITKPFDPIELRARVDLRLRKAAERKLQEEVFVKGSLVFNVPLQKLVCKQKSGDLFLDLTAFEFKLLLYMAKHEDHVLSREQIYQAVWGESIHVSDRTIDSHMSNLRKRLSATDFTIKSVYGSGYKFTAQDDAGE